MTRVILLDKCAACGKCVEVCPVDCIQGGLKDNPEWNKYYIDPATCTDCGACEPECPVSAIVPESEVAGDESDSILKNSDFFEKGPGYSVDDTNTKSE